MVIVIVSFIRHTMYYAVLYFLQFISNHRILNTLADIYLLIRMICIILKQYRKAIKLFKYCFLQHHFKYLTKKNHVFSFFYSIGIRNKCGIVFSKLHIRFRDHGQSTSGLAVVVGIGAVVFHDQFNLTQLYRVSVLIHGQFFFILKWYSYVGLVLKKKTNTVTIVTCVLHSTTSYIIIQYLDSVEVMTKPIK